MSNDFVKEYLVGSNPDLRDKSIDMAMQNVAFVKPFDRNEDRVANSVKAYLALCDSESNDDDSAAAILNQFGISLPDDGEYDGFGAGDLLGEIDNQAIWMYKFAREAQQTSTYSLKVVALVDGDMDFRYTLGSNLDALLLAEVLRKSGVLDFRNAIIEKNSPMTFREALHQSGFYACQYSEAFVDSLCDEVNEQFGELVAERFRSDIESTRTEGISLTPCGGM